MILVLYSEQQSELVEGNVKDHLRLSTHFKRLLYNLPIGSLFTMDRSHNQIHKR